AAGARVVGAGAGHEFHRFAAFVVCLSAFGQRGLTMEFQSEYLVLFDRVQVRYYGIIIVAAMLVAATVAARLAKRVGKDPDHVWGALTWAIIPAIILARAWYVLFPPISAVQQGIDTTYLLQNFFNLENGAIAIWSGGLSIFGAFLGGLLGA